MIVIFVVGVVVQCGITIALYYARIKSHTGIVQSDAVVFWLPALLGVAFYFLACRRMFPGMAAATRTIIAAACALVTAIIALVVSVGVGIRYWGS
jgi:hypothetical protein